MSSRHGGLLCRLTTSHGDGSRTGAGSEATGFPCSWLWEAPPPRSGMTRPKGGAMGVLLTAVLRPLKGAMSPPPGFDHHLAGALQVASGGRVGVGVRGGQLLYRWSLGDRPLKPAFLCIAYRGERPLRIATSSNSRALPGHRKNVNPPSREIATDHRKRSHCLPVVRLPRV